MPANLENSAVATGLEKVSFHSNLKERQCQRMFKLSYNCTHFTCQKEYAQNSSSQASAVHEPRTSRCTSWIQERQRNQISNCQHLVIEKAREFRKTSTSTSLAMLKLLTVWITTNWKILKEMGIPDHPTCLLRNLYAGQEATVRTGHGTTNWFQIGKGGCQGCISSPCLFNLYAEYIMRNAGLDEAQAGIKIAGRNMQMTPHL